MDRKLRIIFLSPYLPASDTSACARKVYDNIRFLSQRGYCVYLLAFCSEQDKDKIGGVSIFCAKTYVEYINDYSRYPLTSSIFKQKIEYLCAEKRVDILQCEKSYMSRYIPDGVKVVSVLVEHEVLSESFKQRAECEVNLFKKAILYLRSAKKYFEEKTWYSKFKLIVVFTNEDKVAICKYGKRPHIEVIPLGIKDEAEAASSGISKDHSLLFVGNFLHSPNVDAVFYFYNKIWPLIKRYTPNVSLMVAGAAPPPDILRLAVLDSKISVTGYQKDLSQAYSGARVFIAPIRYGTGMRFKILEALMHGLPVVATSLGANGFIPTDSLRIAKTAEEFAEEVIYLLHNEENLRALGESGEIFVKQYYNWDVILNRYENVYRILLNDEENKHGENDLCHYSNA